jgi:hypothetical protein
MVRLHLAVVVGRRAVGFAAEATTPLGRAVAAVGGLDAFDGRSHRSFQCCGAISGREPEIGEKGTVDAGDGSIRLRVNPVGPGGPAGLRCSRIVDVMDDSEEQICLIALVGIEVTGCGPGITDLGGSHDRVNPQLSTRAGIITLRGDRISPLSDLVSLIGDSVPLILQAHDVVRKVTRGHALALTKYTPILLRPNSP